MLKTFYITVTERDCTLEQAKRFAKDYPNQPSGPLVHECYLTEDRMNEAKVRNDADARRFDRYGWVRVVPITVDVPE